MDSIYISDEALGVGMNLVGVFGALITFALLIYFIFGRDQLKSLLLLDLLSGLRVTGKKLFEPKTTLHFPDEGESLPTSPRFKGMLALRRYENGQERCIACKLCEAVCPALAINIESHEHTDGTRRTTRFDIDAFKCINCGLCAEACPVDSIVCTDEMNYSFLRRGDNIMTKEQLLAIGDLYEDQIARNMEKDRA